MGNMIEKMMGKKAKQPTKLTDKQAKTIYGGAKEKFERERPSGT